MSDAEALVYVALIGAIVSPFVTGALQRRGTKRELEQRVGTPNGHGNLVEMSERMLDGQARQDDRIARLERHDLRRQRVDLDHEGRIAALEAKTQERT